MNKKLKILIITFTVLILITVVGVVIKVTTTSSSVKNEGTSKFVKGNDLQEMNKEGYRVVGYYTDWSVYAREVFVDSIDGNLLTHLNVAFADVDEQGAIKIGDEYADVQMVFGDALGVSETGNGIFGQLGLLKKKYPHLNVLIAVGGWTWAEHLASVIENSEKQAVFVKSCVDFLVEYNFDGVDIDWDKPEILTSDNTKDNFTELMKSMREALDAQGKIDGKRYYLTLTGPANQKFINCIDPNALREYVDFYNIMTYDIHGAWETKTNFNAPLYADTDKNGERGMGSVDWVLKAFTEAGFSTQEINLGAAFYGRGWSNVATDNDGLFQEGKAIEDTGYGKGTWDPGIFDYWDLQENYVDKGNYKRYFDEISKTPYLYNGDVFITYDDKESLKYKLDYLKENDFGGTMFWEFSGDKNKDLQTFIADELGINKNK